MTENKFQVKYHCGNCGDKWPESHPARTVVRQVNTSHVSVAVVNKDCGKMLDECDDCCKAVRCPTCDMIEHVSIEDRNPLVEGDDGE